MKVGIDSLGCNSGKGDLGLYLLSFINALKPDRDTQFEIFGLETDKYIYTKDSGLPFCSVDVKDSPASQRLWHFLFAPRFIRKRGYDAVLYAAAMRMIPMMGAAPSVALINEIAVNALGKENFIARALIKRGLRKADVLVVPSMFVKKSLPKAGLGNPAVEVVHNGLDHSLFFPLSEEERENDVADIKPFSIKKPYLLYENTVSDKAKRHIELIKAFTLFKERFKSPLRLVLAGDGLKPYVDEVQKAILRSNAKEDIFLTGSFPIESIPALYKNAHAVVFPSIDEGVGLGVLEAMASGVPVACSREGSLREIAGNNAVFFDSADIEAAASAIEKVSMDGAVRARLSDDAAVWAQKFSWDTCTSECVALLRAVSEKAR